MRQPVAELVRQSLSSVALTPQDLGGGGKKAPVLFPSNQVGRTAAAFVLENSLLEMDTSGVGGIPSLTERGWDWLRGQGAPVLNDFLRQVEQWKDQDRVLISKIRENSSRLDRLENALKKLLGVMGESVGGTPGASGDLKATILRVLASCPQGNEKIAEAGCDVTLPDLFQLTIAKGNPKLSLGAFQDALRELHGEGKVLFHPWTGTLYSIPEPGLAFLVGHEIAYYVSLKNH